MNCRSAESLFSAFLEDALSQTERRSFEAHLLGCRRCSVSLREFKGTLSLLGDVAKAPAPEVGPHFDEDLMARIRSGEAMRPSMIEWLRGAFAFDRLRPALAAGAAACVLVVAVVLYVQGSQNAVETPGLAASDEPAAAATAPSATDVAQLDARGPERQAASAPQGGASSVTPTRPTAAAPAAPTLAASTPAASTSRSRPASESEAIRLLTGDDANGIIQVVDRVVPGNYTEVDSAFPNPDALFTDEYVTDQFYLQRAGAVVGPRLPTSVPVTDRGSDDVYIEF